MLEHVLGAEPCPTYSNQSVFSIQEILQLSQYWWEKRLVKPKVVVQFVLISRFRPSDAVNMNLTSGLD